MNKEQAKERIEKLKKVIREARYSYHVLDKSIMSDSASDSLKHELFELEQQYPDLITPDSPTQRIGGKPLEEFKKIRHLVSQWSFNDVFNEEEIRNFDKRMKKELSIPEVDYTCELKIDGLHIILTYEKGILKTGATRGDGKIGEDVTQNLKTIEAIPLHLKKDASMVAEGEVFMRKSVFEKLNQQRKKQDLVLFANPRNAAAGAIRQLDPKIASQRHLDCFIYDYSWPEKDIPETQFEELKELMDLGFKVNKSFEHCENIEGVIEFWKKWQKKKDSQDYWIDGIVVKVNKREFQNRLGYTGKAPRWAIAFKWPGEQAATILEKVVFQVGRTGKLTPVAWLKPINIAGTTVSRATLHNSDEIKRLGIKIGDTVIVEKAGDVIPHIVKYLPELRPKEAKKIQIPDVCPVCGSRVIKPEGEVAHYCSNKNCGSIQKRKLYWFVSKKGFDIEGLGPKIIDQLMDAGLVSKASDIFQLREGDLEPLERFAQKSASNLVEAIGKSKTISLSKFIASLGIKYVGEETAELLAENVTKIEEIPKLNLESIEGIGPKVTESIKDWFNQKENAQLLKDLEKAGIIIKSDKLENKSQKLLNKSFVFTGEMESMSREKAHQKVKQLGGKTPSSLSQKTDYLVKGKNPGSKLKQAQELNLKIISEKEFQELIK